MKTAISLFSGMGGLDLGISKAGFTVPYHVDYDENCVKTLRKNWKSGIVDHADISKLTGREILKKLDMKRLQPDLIIGGPSCQPFSRSNEGKRKGLKDHRGSAVLEYARLVSEIRPKAFIMENVGGILSSGKGKDFKVIDNELRKTGYDIHYGVLNAADYGVPQKRIRFFAIGFRKKTQFRFPNGGKEHVPVSKVLARYDEGVIHDPSEIVGGKWGHLLAQIPPGQNYNYLSEKFQEKPVFRYRSKFWTFLLKLDPNQPSSTIQAQPWNSVGPFHWNNRRLKIKEIKAIQTIPQGYYVSGQEIEGYQSPAWVQIGNAVPPLLAEKVGRAVREYLR